MQTRSRYLPFSDHAPLRKARQLSHVNEWHLSVTPPKFCIYIIFHLWLHAVYIGITTSAPVQRLRKHMTDNLAHVDHSNLHLLMCKTCHAHWSIGVLEYISDDWWAAVRERHWWFIFKHWAVNNVPPGIPLRDGPPQNNGWLNQRILELLRALRVAQEGYDHARVKFLQQELQEAAQELSIPLHLMRCIVVPNMSPSQCTAIHKCIRMCLFSTSLKAWEKQATIKMIRVVRSSPHNMKSIFERHAKKWSLLPSRPQCSCLSPDLSDLPACTIKTVDGHRALVPVVIRLPTGANMRPKDPLLSKAPVPGKEQSLALKPLLPK